MTSPVMIFTCPSCKEEFDGSQPVPGEAVKCPLCGYRFADTEATVVDDSRPMRGDNLQPGTELAGFEIQSVLGRGAMGVVYEAKQLSLDRTVALKVLPASFSENEQFVERFYEESGALSALNHPNIVTIYERGHVGNIYFFAMEYVDGPSLRELMKSGVQTPELLRVARATASALSYAHQRGVVHRDVKPSNIVINSAGQVKIADFGLAGLIRQEPEVPTESSRHTTIMGTPAYMSPEQKLNSLAVDGRSDIYSLGVVLFEACTAEKPILPLEKLPSQMDRAADPRLDPIIQKCLQERAENRYQTATELLNDLEKLSEELTNAPKCSGCGHTNPVRFEHCQECGQDLEEHFDICPECKGKNRREVRRCLNCGTDLQKGRTLLTDKVTMMLDQADKLRLDGAYLEALEILDEVQEIEGRAFESQRQRATVLRKTVVQERLKQAKHDYAEARRMLQQNRFREAIALFQRVPADLKDTSKEVKAARELQARLAAELRSQSTFNLVLLTLGLVLMVVIVLLAVL